jgi:hypothetical protein
VAVSLRKLKSIRGWMLRFQEKNSEKKLSNLTILNTCRCIQEKKKTGRSKRRIQYVQPPLRQLRRRLWQVEGPQLKLLKSCCPSNDLRQQWSGNKINPFVHKKLFSTKVQNSEIWLHVGFSGICRNVFLRRKSFTPRNCKKNPSFIDPCVLRLEIVKSVFIDL